MAYTMNTMRIMGGVPGQRLLLYRTADDIADVDDPGYFDSAAEEYNLSTGDIILCVTGFGTTNVLDALVATVTAGVVTTSTLS